MNKKKHITVCICTYKRPELLAQLLEKLHNQDSEELFTISIVVVDNDNEFSAKPIVKQFINKGEIEIVYSQITGQNFALVRNTAVKKATGDYIAFIDDDEYPINNWLLLLYQTIQHYQVSGALGPVVPAFQTTPPKWVVRGKLCERTRLKTGIYLVWEQTRTGNAMLKREIFNDPDNYFDLKFGLGGEDVTFFEKLIDKGHQFVWCDEAIVYEEVPEERLKISYFLKRSELRGYITYYNYKNTRPWIKNIFVFLKSFTVFIIYLFLLPFYLLIGYHRFINLLIRFVHHLTIIRTFFKLLKINKRDI